MNCRSWIFWYPASSRAKRERRLAETVRISAYAKLHMDVSASFQKEMRGEGNILLSDAVVSAVGEGEVSV